MKLVAVIPAHMASVRFPGKILHPFFGHPMIEHVRRRALLSTKIDDVIVATCDEDIAASIKSYGGKVIMTGDHHRNGTTRIAEAIENIDCTHVLLLQGDEPLMMPSYIDAMADAIVANPSNVMWNGTGPIKTFEDIDRHSFVKCAIGLNDKILYCFRRNPSHVEFTRQHEYIRKILGVIAFKKEFLQAVVKMRPTPIEETESIEQMRIIEHDFFIKSVPFEESLPSVNEPSEVDIVLDYIRAHPVQQDLLKQTFGITI
ncbi:MAG: cytidylyltransferase domain-containing protein [Candidatus Puniceispirillales bacterium WSBS_2018_MAG_OTU23]